MKPDLLFSYIDKTWPNSESGRLAKLIVAGVFSLRDQETACLTYSDLMEISGIKVINAEFHSALTILTAGKFSLFTPYGIFVDREGSEFPIRGLDFQNLLITNTLVHPSTGEIIVNARQHVAPVFEAMRGEVEAR